MTRKTLDDVNVVEDPTDYNAVCDVEDCEQVLTINENIFIWTNGKTSECITTCYDCGEYYEDAESRLEGWERDDDDDNENEWEDLYDEEMVKKIKVVKKEMYDAHKKLYP